MAINYQEVLWDTTKYVNPTNMNQMDSGIKSACDGVDEMEESITTISGDVETLQTNLGQPSEASAVSGNSAFSKITTINNKIGYTIKTHTGDSYNTILSRVANVVTLTIHTSNLIANGASIGTSHIDWKPKNAQSYLTIAWFPSENKMGRVYVNIATNGNISFSALDINNSFYIPCTTVIYETT